MIFFLLILNVASANEILFRYNNLGTQPLQFSGEKIASMSYDYNLNKNLYIEGTIGQYYANDFDTWTSILTELSPGIKIKSGALILKLSQGIAYIPYWQLPSFEYVTHASVSLLDDNNKLNVGIERTHYSTGQSNSSNIGLDMTGIIIGIQL